MKNQIFKVIVALEVIVEPGGQFCLRRRERLGGLRHQQRCHEVLGGKFAASIFLSIKRTHEVK